MNKKEVYKRKYSKKELDSYERLVEFIKKNHHEDKKWIDSSIYQYNYLDYDSDFLTITRIWALEKSYDKPINIAKITIDKIGPDLNKESAIEKILLKAGFKKELE